MAQLNLQLSKVDCLNSASVGWELSVS